MTGTHDETDGTTEAATHEETYLTWGEVVRVHLTLRAVRVPPTPDPAATRSVLALFGADVPYPSEWHGDDLWLAGEVEAVEQGTDPANRGLVIAEVHALPVRVFERVRPNSWRDRGYYHVREHHAVIDRARGRRVPQFLLSPMDAAGAAEMDTTRIATTPLGTERPR